MTLLHRPIQELMSTHITTVAPEENLQRAVETMAHSNIGAIIIVSNNTPVGIFTERDLLKRVVAKGLTPENTTVGTVMTPKIISVTPNQPVVDVIQKMYTMAIRHMAVMQEGQLLGIFSIRDLMRHLLVPDGEKS